jgi:DNA-binding NarL/FixJ family response regulator
MTPAQAYSAVKNAIVRGRISRPTSCERCGETPEPASDGRSKIHAHHHDYSRPLDVEWICSKCHRAETPLPDGEKNGQAKLTRERVIAIRRLSQIGLASQAIAERIGVHRSTVSRVISGKSWGWLAAQEDERNG